MSHFSVLVITKAMPTKEHLAEILQPWHEFESTGVKDEYVVWEDHTDQMLLEWANKKRDGYRGPDGKPYKGWEPCFYREATPEERAKCDFGGIMGFNGSFIYHTIYCEPTLLVLDPVLSRALAMIAPDAPYDIPRGWRLPSVAERSEIASFVAGRNDINDQPDDDKVVEHHTTSGLVFAYHSLRLREPRTMVKIKPHPEGFKAEQFAVSELYPNIDAYVAEEHGYEKNAEGRWGRWTNPQKKWDWWVIGGRYANRLLVRQAVPSLFTELQELVGNVRANRRMPPDMEKAERAAESIIRGRANGHITDVEARGLFAHLKREGVADAKIAEWTGRCFAPHVQPQPRMTAPPKSVEADWCQMRDLDFPAMQERAIAAAAERWDEFHEATGGAPIPDFRKLCDEHGAEKAREIYGANEAVQGARKAGFFFDIDDWANISREDALARGKRRALTAYAVVKDGKWYERGEMGWWGISHNEKDEAAWEDEFAKLIGGLSPDTYICFVDCHI